ncbi:MAG TPA: PspA/IM30 family protein [Polyangiaceae bacterium]
MGLFDRMSRAASANFNALIDKLDDPRKSIDLTITEMEEQLRLARREIVQGVASEKQLKKKMEELESDAARWEKRAELAVQHGDDELAREALRHKRRLTDDRNRAETLRVQSHAAALDLRSDLERMERTVSEVKAKRGLLAAQVGQARAATGGGSSGLGARPGEDPFGEFRRMEDQIEGVEHAIAAEREVSDALKGGASGGGMSREEVEARFRALETNAESRGREDDVDAELSALKSKIRIEPG